MIVTPVHEHGIEFAKSAPGYTRGEGLHMSTLYNAMYASLEPKRFEGGTGPDPLKMEAGLAWEELLERAIKERVSSQFKEGSERPHEMVEPEYGIIYSPDLLIFNGVPLRLGEIKLTWMSCREMPMEATNGFPPKFDKWLTQIKLYCVDGATRILTDDLRWVRADTVRVGDKLLAFDEEPTTLNQRRRWQHTTVTASRVVTRPSYEVTFEDGSQIICSGDHQWLGRTSGTRHRWLTTSQLCIHDNVWINKPLEVWEPRTDYDAGYVAAGFDGEGHLAQQRETGVKQLYLGFAQKDNVMLAQMRHILRDWGLHEQKGQASGVHTLNLARTTDVFKFLGTFRPKRLLENFSQRDLPCPGFKRSVRVVKSRSIGPREVQAITTDTGTYIAEGFTSHNCRCLETPYARLMGFFVNGNYSRNGDGGPKFLVWDLEFSARELREEWDTVIGFAKGVKLL